MNGEPTLVSLFAGCGGSSLGYKWAGFRELLAVEWDGNAVETFKLNFPGVPVWKRDIRKVQGREILEFCSLRKGELDLLDGSPPCQGFSITGKRQILDQRNDLFLENIRLIREIEPKIFIIENVSGLIKGKMKGLFNEYMEKLKSLPYQVKCKLMNAKWYRVPQSRLRLIWIGVRKDLQMDPVFPELNWKVIPVVKALEGVQNKTFIPMGKVFESLWYRMRPGMDGTLGERNKRKYWNTKKLHPMRPSFTLLKTINPNYALIMHWVEPRSLTIEEAKRIQSFPDNFQLSGTFRQQWAGIGNSVPPRMMEAIAGHVKNRILSSAGNN